MRFIWLEVPRGSWEKGSRLAHGPRNGYDPKRPEKEEEPRPGKKEMSKDGLERMLPTRKYKDEGYSYVVVVRTRDAGTCWRKQWECYTRVSG